MISNQLWLITKSVVQDNKCVFPSVFPGLCTPDYLNEKIRWALHISACAVSVSAYFFLCLVWGGLDLTSLNTNYKGQTIKSTMFLECCETVRNLSTTMAEGKILNLSAARSRRTWLSLWVRIWQAGPQACGRGGWDRVNWWCRCMHCSAPGTDIDYLCGSEFKQCQFLLEKNWWIASCPIWTEGWWRCTSALWEWTGNASQNILLLEIVVNIFFCEYLLKPCWLWFLYYYLLHLQSLVWLWWLFDILKISSSKYPNVVIVFQTIKPE